MTREDWRSVPGYQGLYEVSSLGRVRSLPRMGTAGKVLVGATVRGYQSVDLWCENQASNWRVNRLVATTFHRPALPGEVCRHLNGNSLDNRACNLAWGSEVENAADTLRMGRHFNANKTHCPSGHSYTPANTYLTRRTNSVGRRCKACHQEAKRRRAVGMTRPSCSTSTARGSGNRRIASDTTLTVGAPS